MCDIYRPPTKLGEGNIFTGVCHSVHKGGIGYHWSQVPSWSLVPCPFGGVGYLWSHVPSWGVKVSGGRVSGDRVYPLPGYSTPTWKYKSERYTSYWNAFLCVEAFVVNKAQHIIQL